MKNYQIIIWSNSSVGPTSSANPVWVRQTLEPTTGPEVVEWAKFHRYNFTEKLEMPLKVQTPYADPRIRGFEVHRLDNSPLSRDDLDTFGKLTHDEIDDARKTVFAMSPQHRHRV